MTETFCTTFSCRQRSTCKRGLPIEELQGTKAYMHTDGYCTGYIPLNEKCFKPKQTWLDKVLDIEFRFF